MLIPTGQTVDILLDVTNPGLWMAHGHIAEHMQSGMMFSFTVDRAGDLMTAPGRAVIDVVVVWRRPGRPGRRLAPAPAGAAVPGPGGSGELGHTWRTRWESLRLFTPAKHDALPGLPFPAPAGTYPGKEAVAEYLQDYAAAFAMPVKLDARVTRAAARPTAGSHLSTADRTYTAPAGDRGHRTVPDAVRPAAGRRLDDR